MVVVVALCHLCQEPLQQPKEFQVLMSRPVGHPVGSGHVLGRPALAGQTLSVPPSARGWLAVLKLQMDLLMVRQAPSVGAQAQARAKVWEWVRVQLHPLSAEQV